MIPPPRQGAEDMAVTIAEVRRDVAHNTTTLLEHSHDIKTLYKALSYRLPLWATFLISGLTFFNGWLVAVKF